MKRSDFFKSLAAIAVAPMALVKKAPEPKPPTEYYATIEIDKREARELGEAMIAKTRLMDEMLERHNRVREFRGYENLF